MNTSRTFGKPMARAKNSAGNGTALKTCVALLIALLAHSGVRAQDPIWSSGDQVVHFPQGAGSISTSALPTSFLTTIPASYQYQGGLPQYSQNVQYNTNGDLQFFIIDGNIYNAQGLLIADADGPSCLSCMWHGGSRIAIVPVPGSCTQYFIISGKDDTDRDEEGYAVVRIGLLDLSLPNDFPGYGGNAPFGRFISDNDASYSDLIAGGVAAPMNWMPIGNTATPQVEFVWDYTLPFSWQDSNHEVVRFDVIEIGPNGRRLLVLESARTIHFLLFPEPGLYSDQSPRYIAGQDKNMSPYGSEYDDIRSARGEVEASRQGSTLKVAFSNYTDETPYEHVLRVGYVQFDASGITAATPTLGLPLVSSPASYIVDAYVTSGVPPILDYKGDPIEHPRVCGLEFSPNGEYIWFVKSSYTPSHDYNLGYINTSIVPGSSGDVTGFTAVGTNVDSRKLADTEMETNVGPTGTGTAMYMIRAENTTPPTYYLATVTGANTPSTATWDPDALGGSLGDIAIRGGIGDIELRVLDARVANSTHLATLQALSCCQALSAIAPGGNGYSYSGVNAFATAWAPGSNPFPGAPAELVFTSNFEVQPGATLYVNNMTWRFDDNARLIIKPGGRAHFYNSTLTSLACPMMRWPGVAVNGVTSNLAQGSAQGALFLHNSEVSNARNGVWCATMAAGVVLPSGNGGFVKAYNTIFRNNITGVRIRDYHRFNGTIPQANASSFSNCEFITDDDWPDFGLNHPKMHADLNRVDRIKFQNCAFRNDAWAYFPITWWGSGIVAKNATINCTGGMNYTTNRFVNLWVGAILQNSTVNFVSTVDGMGFDQNGYGLIDWADQLAVITNNRFQMNDQAPLATSIGLTILQSELYTVERNLFTVGPTPSATTVGIYFSGPAYQQNRIYDNTFEHLDRGCLVYGDHRASGSPNLAGVGLQMLCGDYTDNVIDQDLVYGVPPNNQTSIRAWQGELLLGPEYAANNAFNTPPDCANTWQPYVDPTLPTGIGTETDVRYHYLDNSGSPQMRPECAETTLGTPILPLGGYYDLVPVASGFAFDPVLHCNDGILDGEAGGHLVVAESYFQSLEELASAVVAYNGQVDGGNSPDLAAEINYSTPWHPSYYLRDLLLGNAPLSDHIMYEAIHRAQPMDPWHLTQVLIQNSPLSSMIKTELQNTGVLNAFFLNLLDQFNQGVSLRTVLEMEIYRLQSEKALLQVRELLYWASDTVTDGRLDSIHAVLAADTFGLADRLRYKLFVAEGDYTAAQELAQAWFSDPETERLVAWGQLMQEVGGDWENADPTVVSELWDRAFGEEGYPDADAWSTLRFLEETDSLPPVFLSPIHRSVTPGSTVSANSTWEPVMAAYPNPARSEVAIILPRGAAYDQLQVFDAQGRLVRTIDLAGNEAFAQIDLKGWSEGLYLARVMLEGFTMGECKFTVLK